MTLRRRMALQIVGIIVGLLLTIATGLWGLNGLRQDYGVALQGYQSLRELYEVGSRLIMAQTLLAATHPDRAMVTAEVDAAAARLDLSETIHQLAASKEIGDAIHAAQVQVHQPPEADFNGDPLTRDQQLVSAALWRTGNLAGQVRQTIEQSQQAAQLKRRQTMIAMTVVSIGAVLWAILIGVRQYRSVMRPLNALAAGVRRMAGAEFTGSVDERGDEEFSDLARKFNRMAAELHGFYTQLEQKVAQKSRELVRSERLASVGFLAAGVAHEINNPLGIISGYSEFSLDELRRLPAGAQKEELARSLRIICDEAFRCKEITQRLLSLARGSEEPRRPVDLVGVAEQVVTIVRGLREYRDRKITLGGSGAEAAWVLADGSEMKQVVLNLAVNALQAAAPEVGEVKIEVHAMDGWIELSVIDNGRGINVENLDRVFEPFYTEKRGSQQPGTGLGLAITHAIVSAHGGTIAARSEGAGKGSTFTVRLPASAGPDSPTPAAGTSGTAGGVAVVSSPRKTVGGAA